LKLAHRPLRIVKLGVGDLTLEVRAAAPAAFLDLPSIYDPFLVNRGADVRLAVIEESVPRPLSGQCLFDSGGIWSLHRQDSHLLYIFRSPATKPRTYKGLRIDAALRDGQLYFPPSSRRPRYALDYPLDELLFQHRLIREDGLEVHACGIAVDGRALVFVGDSGAGKSTTASLWIERVAEARVLSDDRVVLRRRNDRFLAFGTPWHGTGGFAAAEAWPVGALLFLEHSSKDALVPLRLPDAVTRLLARSFPPMWDAALLARVIETCHAVAESTPAYVLRFSPRPSAVSIVLDELDAL
jgi:hypothetical protein